MDIKTIGFISLVLSCTCSLVITVDILNGHRHKMWIMNIVWPVTALYSSLIGLWTYFAIGRALSEKKPIMTHGHFKMNGRESDKKLYKKISWQQIVKGTLHCGSGCTLGDLFSEIVLFLFPLSLFGSKLYSRWTIDYFFAFLFGIMFQYYSIKPMKDLSPGKALRAAFKADALSLTCWQIGMYGWMAICFFGIFHHPLEASDPVFWLMMQVAMFVGFITALPINWLLIKKGIKEMM